MSQTPVGITSNFSDIEDICLRFLQCLLNLSAQFLEVRVVLDVFVRDPIDFVQNVLESLHTRILFGVFVPKG